MNNGNQPAHPVKLTYIESVDLTHEELREVASRASSGQPFSSKKNVEKTEDFAGLTKREMIAAMAMSGILSNPSCNPTEQVHFLYICEDAVRATDQLLKQLETK